MSQSRQKPKFTATNKMDALKWWLTEWSIELDCKYTMEEYRHHCDTATAKDGLTHGLGYHSETGQSFVSIGLLMGTDIAKVSAEINEILDLIKPYKGEKAIQINESTLGDEGIYALHHNSTGWVLVRWFYFSRQEIKQFDSLIAALAYIQENHPATDYDSAIWRRTMTGCTVCGSLVDLTSDDFEVVLCAECAEQGRKEAPERFASEMEVGE